MSVALVRVTLIGRCGRYGPEGFSQAQWARGSDRRNSTGGGQTSKDGRLSPDKQSEIKKIWLGVLFSSHQQVEGGVLVLSKLESFDRSWGKGEVGYGFGNDRVLGLKIVEGGFDGCLESGMTVDSIHGETCSRYMLVQTPRSGEGVVDTHPQHVGPVSGKWVATSTFRLRFSRL